MDDSRLTVLLTMIGEGNMSVDKVCAYLEASTTLWS
jgi:hypothetical protein